MTTKFLTNVRREPRGRLHLSKAVAELEARIHTSISSFDVYLDSENAIVLRPKREIPATATIDITYQQAQHLAAVVDQRSEPSARLLAAAERFADRLTNGEITEEVPGSSAMGTR